MGRSTSPIPGGRQRPRNPVPTVDVIIEFPAGVCLVKRRNPPYGWALPGGFIDYGESAPHAARREAREETGLRIRLTELFYVYSDPGRDPRMHTISIVYLARTRGTPVAGDDAADVGIFGEENLPSPLAFDHGRILADYFRFERTGERPRP